ncbi:hypothetical protein ACS0TY_021796 [Phlomoides rotata]
MGRRKLEIKRIEDKSARQVTFSKRRNGLLKKARELSVLCDLDIGVVIYSCRGKPYHYSNTNSLTEILERYHSSVTKDSSPPTGDCNTQAQSSKYSEFPTCGELLQIVERDVEGDELSVNDIVHLEEQLENALIQTRKAKTRSLLESISSLHHEEKLLEEEKRLLEAKIGGSSNNKVGIDLNMVPDDETQIN